MVSIADLDTFGDVAAEDDAVLNYFLSTKEVNLIADGKAFLVLGRKGTGKTAIVRYFSERSDGSLSRALNLRGYPWNVHASRVDNGASEIEAYVSSWRYLIAVELASLILSHPKRERASNWKVLKKFLDDNYGGTNPELSNILRPKRLKLEKFSLAPSIMGNALGGVDLDRSKGDHQLGLELNALSQAIIDSVIQCAGEINTGSVSLHFDELDQGMTELSEDRKRMLIGLIIAAREVKRECEARLMPINPVVYLRSDLWNELSFSDKNKISSTLTLYLNWSAKTLLDLVENRLRAKLGPEARWDDIATSGNMRGSQTKWNHVIARTFLRPRDVIKFLNIALVLAKKNDDVNPKIDNKNITNSREEYSAYLKAELDDEIKPHWSAWDDALQAVSAISTEKFERHEFEGEYDKRSSGKATLSAAEALSFLYRFSVIGYERRSGYGGSSWTFQYTDPGVGWDNAATKFKVHPGLKEYARLREARQ